MASRELQESWKRTSSHLAQAAALLPSKLVASDDGERLEQYREFLDHNELELALDTLEALAEHNPVPTAFWWYMDAAATEMKLADHCARYGELLKNSRTSK